MARPLRFVHLSTFYPPYSFGGDAMYVHRLARALGDRGHRVDVVHCVDSYRMLAGRRATPAPLPAHPNVAVHGLRSRLGWMSPLLSQQTGRPWLKRGAIQRVLDGPAGAADVVHFHNASLFGPAALAMSPRGAPSITLSTAHEHWLVCPMHVLWKYNSRVCERPACVRCTLAAGRPPQLWRYTSLLARSVRHVDQFLSPSRFTAGVLAERGFAPPVAHLPPFAPAAETDRHGSGPSPHPRPFFLYVGRLERVKGIAPLVRAWAGVRDGDLIVIGDGSERPAVAAASADDPRVELRGALPPRALGPYYAHARALIVPSIAYEVAPTVVLEAFAHRTPVIARDLGGAAELVRDGGGAEMLYRDEAGLVEAVRRLAGDADLRRALGERGYEAYLRRWTEDAHVTAYLSLVDEVARRKFGEVPWQSRS